MTHVDALLLQQQGFRADELRAATDRAEELAKREPGEPGPLKRLMRRRE
jgi:hypothetical protein